MNKYTKAINEAHEKYHYEWFAVRTGRKAEVGEIIENSYQWNEDVPREEWEELNGTCGTGIGDLWFDGDEDDDVAVEKAIAANAGYPGEMQYIIGGKYADYGNDESEVIIECAEVICIIE